MHLFSILHVFGTLFIVTGISLAAPLVCALIYGEGDFMAIFASALLILFLGVPLWWGFRKHLDLEMKDGIFIAAFGWVLVSALSTLPFMIHGSIPTFTDAFFEMMSGYTTSGATILTDIEAMPHGLLFWRSQTHLLGGMGFLTLTVIFLPHGMGGLRIFRAESSPGQVITKEKFHARNRDTMIRLWIIYVVLNVAQTFLMCLGGMPLFDFPLPRLRHRIHLRLLTLQRQHRPLRQRLFRLDYHSLHVSRRNDLRAVLSNGPGGMAGFADQHRIPRLCGVDAVFLRNGLLDSVERKHLRPDGLRSVRDLSGDQSVDHHRFFHG